MTLLVNNFIENKNEPVTVMLSSPFSEALDKMLDNDFSQLPVIDEHNIPIGFVTYQSITRTLLYRETPLEELTVSDVYEEINKAQIFRGDDELSDMLDRLRDMNAILIVDAKEKLTGIVTTYDSTEYFRAHSEDLLNVQDIESTIKDLLRYIYQQEEDEPDNERLSLAIEKVTKTNRISKREYAKSLQHYADSLNLDKVDQIAMEKSFELLLHDDAEVRAFSDLTLGDYIALLLDKDIQSQFEQLFNHSPAQIEKLLDNVRKIRNDLAHLREITPTQRDQLLHCKKLLDRITIDTQIAEQEEKTKDVQGKPAEDFSQIVVTDEETLPGESRYAPLADWLNSQPGSIDQVKLTFAEIEEIIGGELPNSAYDHRAWWANDSVAHQHSILWLEVGWRRSYLNMSEKHVTFVRIKEREKSYIDFFNEVTAKLREKAEFPIKDISPDGQSWIVCQSLSIPGYSDPQLSYSFARGNRFRVELYIDTGNRDTNKKLFDLIRIHQADLEEKVGEISWERIDNKRASRIALYHPGSITEDSNTLAALRDWAVDKMVDFYNAIEPIATQAAGEIQKE